VGCESVSHLPRKSEREEKLIMKNTCKVWQRKWLVVGVLLLLMSITSIGNAQTSGLTAAETYWLTYMREVEKLARDVYIVQYDSWGSWVFSNISVSEQRHMDAIKNLLDRYGVPDPVGGNGLGVFTNPDIQSLYDDLIFQGSLSLVNALEVGVIIEETDIDDLYAALKSTKRRDIKKVYNNLLQASFNHLDAFNTNLARY
jgi:hypothetical protein